MDETTDNRMDIAGYLAGLRSSKNWTIKQWEAVSGVSGQTITRILDGQTAPQFQTVAALVRSAGGSLDELAGIQHEPTVIHDYTPQQHTSDLIANLKHNVQYLKEEKAKSHGDDQDRIEALEGTIKKAAAQDQRDDRCNYHHGLYLRPAADVRSARPQLRLYLPRYRLVSGRRVNSPNIHVWIIRRI